EGLRDRNIKLAVESLSQNWVDQPVCGKDVEGYGHPGEPATIVNKLKRVGGTLSYVVMDEPLWFGHFYSGPNACHSSVSNVADRVAGIIEVYRRGFPDLVVGDIEPIPSLTGQPSYPATYASWLAAF